MTAEDSKGALLRTKTTNQKPSLYSVLRIMLGKSVMTHTQKITTAAKCQRVFSDEYADVNSSIN